MLTPGQPVDLGDPGGRHPDPGFFFYFHNEPLAVREYQKNPGLYFFLNDHLGTPQKLIDTAGAVVWAAAYLPYGEAQVQANSTIFKLILRIAKKQTALAFLPRPFSDRFHQSRCLHSASRAGIPTPSQTPLFQITATSCKTFIGCIFFSIHRLDQQRLHHF